MVTYAGEFTQAYAGFEGGHEFWLAGRVSPLFLKNFTDLGWTIRTDLRELTVPVIPWDQEVPTDDEVTE